MLNKKTVRLSIVVLALGFFFSHNALAMQKNSDGRLFSEDSKSLRDVLQKREEKTQEKFKAKNGEIFFVDCNNSDVFKKHVRAVYNAAFFKKKKIGEKIGENTKDMYIGVSEEKWEDDWDYIIESLENQDGKYFSHVMKTDGGKVVAFIFGSINGLGKDIYYGDYLGTDPEFSGKSLGGRLILSLFDLNLSLNKISLRATEGSFGFYIEHGFTLLNKDLRTFELSRDNLGKLKSKVAEKLMKIEL